jgi:hypothetical protein
MSEYAKRLAYKVIGVFLGAMALAMSGGAFDILTFDWRKALVASASLAAVALVDGLAGRFTGDPDAPTVTR